MNLRTLLPGWKRSTLAQRLEDSRVLLNIHGYIRPVENERIKRRILREWAVEPKRLAGKAARQA